MDGCWEPWLVGCRIDWQAWSAIGTFLAVAAALFIARRDRRDRRRAEVIEGKLLARLCLNALSRVAETLHHLDDSFDPSGKLHGLISEQRERDPRIDLHSLAALEALDLTFFERYAARLHVMPNRALESAVEAFIAIQRLERELRALVKGREGSHGHEWLAMEIVLTKSLFADAVGCVSRSIEWNGETAMFLRTETPRSVLVWIDTVVRHKRVHWWSHRFNGWRLRRR